MDFDDDINPPWWRTALRGLGMLLGIIAMAALVMMFIVWLAGFADKGDDRILPIHIDATSPPPPPDNALTRQPPPYGPVPWPDHPGRAPAVSFKGATIAPSRSGAPPAKPAEPAEPVGVSVEDYRAAVESGKKLHIPNPQGECDLSGRGGSASAAALENCFAQRVAR